MQEPDLNIARYPVIIFPEEVRKQLYEHISISEEKPIEPEKPRPNSPDFLKFLFDNLIALFGLCILLSVPLLFIGFILPREIYSSILLLLCAIVMYLLYLLWKGEKKSLLESNIFSLSQYELNKQKYEKDKANYERKIREINSKKHRSKVVSEIIINTTKPNYSITNKRGFAESFFESFLGKWFEKRIFINCTYYQQHLVTYCPDFVYQDENNLHIDIEIDEPYDYITKEPIHYIYNSSFDEFSTAKNLQFTNLGWIVIRFAEEQIIKYPNHCCWVIANVVYKLSKEKLPIYNISEYSKLPKIKRWTYEEAKLMVKNNYRSKYLNEFNPSNVPSKIHTWNKLIKLSKEPTIIEFKERPMDDLPF